MIQGSEYFQQLCRMAEQTDGGGQGQRQAAMLELGGRLQSGGFAAVRRFLDDFRSFLQQYADADSKAAERILELARLVLPEPGRISPSWQDIWTHYGHIIAGKNQVLACIDGKERPGEWQVLLDNPFSNDGIAVYPALTFLDASYLFAYFSADLTQHEYVRLQKVATVLTIAGTDRATLV